MSARRWSAPLAVFVAAATMAAIWMAPVAANQASEGKIRKFARKVAKKQARWVVEKMAPTLSVARAGEVDGLVHFRRTLSFGQEAVIAQHGMVSVVAQCRENISGNQDELRLLGASTGDAFMQGDTPHSGPGVGSNYLTPATPDDNRVLGGIVSTPAGDGLPAADDDIDTGFVMGTDAKAIHIDETTVYALNVAGANCYTSGYVILTG